MASPTSGRGSSILVAILLIVGAAVAGTVGEPRPRRSAAAAPADRPNVVLVLVDDAAFYDDAWMPHTRELLAGHGIDFVEATSPHPACCPARATLVTGQYAQNNGIRNNFGPHSGYRALRDRDNTIGRWLGAAGYQTAMVGKYINGYSGQDRPSGWDHWNPFIGQSSYVSTDYYNDGTPVTREGYVDDISTGYALDYLEEFSANPEPFFVWVSYYAPHRAVKLPGWAAYAYPAPRHLGTLGDEVLPALSSPAFNEKRVSDHPEYVAKRRKVSPAEMQKRFTYRIEALQAADEGVKSIVDALAASGELDNTYIIFTSDNGYLLGEHRLQQKNFIFDDCLKVPFLVRVPSMTSPTVSRLPVALLDIAPTLAELTGAKPERLQDGQSFAAALDGRAVSWRDTQLIQTGTANQRTGGWWVRGVKTRRYTYATNVVTGERQLYDRQRFPAETRNVAGAQGYRSVRRELQRRLAALEKCKGKPCSVRFGAVPPPNLTGTGMPGGR